VNGGFFDNFEYYYLVKSVFKNCDVVYRVLTDHPRDDVINILSDKYENIEQSVYDNIDVGPYYFGHVFRKPLRVDILFCATNSAVFWFLTHRNIQAAKFMIGLADYLPIHEKQEKYFPKNVTLCDERFFQFTDINWQPYRKKILFDKFKDKNYSSKYDYMINLSLVDRRYSKEFMIELVNSLDGSCCIYTGHKNKEYYSWLKEINVDVIIPPVEDFMGLYKTFIYIPYNNGWDATPRLPAEAAFYRKNVLYYDKWNIKAGGYYRHKDIIENFEGLYLKEDDEVINLIENVLTVEG
jgi:uncharacterized short protein YbdD (DUF466 family)